MFSHASRDVTIAERTGECDLMRRMCWSSNHLLSAASIFRVDDAIKYFPMHMHAGDAIYPANRWCTEGFSVASRAIKYTSSQVHGRILSVLTKSCYIRNDGKQRINKTKYMYIYIYIFDFIFLFIDVHIEKRIWLH